jgi:hypothetical protein
MHPSGKADGAADVGGAQVGAGMAAVAVHGGSLGKSRAFKGPQPREVKPMRRSCRKQGLYT